MSPRLAVLAGRLLLTVVAASISVLAQAAPQTSSADETQPSKVDVFAGYSYLSPNGAFSGNKGITSGFTVASSYWFNKYFGGVVETGTHLGDVATFNTLTAGPTFRIPMEGITPFGLATFGINREAPAGVPSKTGFGFVGGGCFELHAFKRIDILLIEAEYELPNHILCFTYGPPVSIRHHLVGAKLSGGQFFKFCSPGP